MYNYECSECHGRCDAGELIGGVCTECREEMQAKRLKNDEVRRMLIAPCEQMTFGFINNQEG